MAPSEQYCFYDRYPDVRNLLLIDTFKTLIYVFYIIITLRYIIVDKAY